MSTACLEKVNEKMFYAIRFGNFELLEGSLINGSNPNAKGLDGRTPLELIASKRFPNDGWDRLISLLTRYGAL